MGSDGAPAMIRVEVAYATPRKQRLIALDIPAGSTAAQAIEESGIRDEFPDMVVDSSSVGIFSRRISLDHELRAGDRVEIYRPLIADPKEIRRQRARKKR